MDSSDLITVASVRADPDESGLTAREDALEGRLGSEDEVDVALLEDSLAKTPWERMQANDDALRFADSLRDALEKRNARPKRTDAQAN